MSNLLDLLPSTETMMHPEKYLPKVALGVAKGLSTDVLGAPVDMIATGLKAVGMNTGPSPVGGSDWIKKTFGVDQSGEDSGAEITGNLASGLMNPAHASLVMAKISAALGASKAAVGTAAISTKAATLIPAMSGILADATKVVSPEVLRGFKYMEQEGTPAEQLFAKTGVYRDPVGDMAKAVISDAPAKLKTDGMKISNLEASGGGNTQSFTVPRLDPLSGNDFLHLPDILDHPELYEKYPKLARTLVTGTGESGGGYYDRATNIMGLGNYTDPDKMLSTILHEAQHGVQSVDGAVGGGAATMFLPKGFSNTIQQSYDTVIASGKNLRSKYPEFSMAEPPSAQVNRTPELATDPDYMNHLSLRDNHLNLLDQRAVATEQYMHIGGEAEARAVETMHAAPKEGFTGTNIPTSYYDRNLSDLTPSPLDSLMKSIGL